ncbi:MULTISPECIES: hypothetical protein [Achromobacter]|uniref:hypothetical protein n=1 Tax=Achromobacter TaxID=222 RepID=UPI00174897A1|nr:MULTISPECIES: hypothetical protein [Achromobacter]
MTNYSLQDVFSHAYELAFAPIQVNVALIGCAIVVLLVLRRAKARWFHNDELDKLVPKYGRKVARQIIRSRRQQSAAPSVPFYHNEPWD